MDWEEGKSLSCFVVETGIENLASEIIMVFWITFSVRRLVHRTRGRVFNRWLIDAKDYVIVHTAIA